MKLIILGAPGAGKGTQAGYICERLGIPSISTGNIFREVMASQSQLGKLIKSYIDAGNLVPDDIVIDVIRRRLQENDCAGGFVLDGFPRTIAQANALDTMTDIDCVLEIAISDQMVVDRMSGRRVCGCGATYHIEYNPPKQDGICDNCNGSLYIRDDDAPETVKARLSVYHRLTEPLRQLYAEQRKLRTVESQDNPADTRKLTFKTLGIAK